MAIPPVATSYQLRTEPLLAVPLNKTEEGAALHVEPGIVERICGVNTVTVVMADGETPTTGTALQLIKQR